MIESILGKKIISYSQGIDDITIAFEDGTRARIKALAAPSLGENNVIQCHTYLNLTVEESTFEQRQAKVA
jgi:hypothetical protein